MFESTVLRRSHDGQSISFGQIAEALLYYQKVHLIIDRGTLLSLVKQIGISNLRLLLQLPSFSSVYCEEILGTHTSPVGSSQVHQYTAINITGHESVGEFRNLAERIIYTLESGGVTRKKAKNFAKFFIDSVPTRKFSGNHFISGGIPAIAKLDIMDAQFRIEAIRKAIPLISGGYEIGESLKFDVIDSDLGIHVFHNINFDLINRSRQSSSLDSLTEAHILTHVLEARADLTLASHYGGDFVTSAINSNIIQVRHKEILRRTGINADAWRNFLEITLPDSPAIAEVIDSGERSFDEFLALLEKASRFKSWLATVNPDEGLIRSYHKEVTSEGWLQKLPVKLLRYLITSALGAAEPISGQIAGITDTFLLDKLIGGWRPNHFIATRLEPFVCNSKGGN